MEAVEKALEAQAAARHGSFAGAEVLFGRDGLHPAMWGISKDQVRAFGDRVRAAMECGELTNSTPAFLPQYPQEIFDDPRRGPNMHQVNTMFIKPYTARAEHRLPGASYAVLENLDAGGKLCELFISHAWDEPVFEFVEHALREWPDDCDGAYVCFVSNPQNLDITDLLSHPDGSPFERVLGFATRPKAVIMLANSRMPIHKRLCARRPGPCPCPPPAPPAPLLQFSPLPAFD